MVPSTPPVVFPFTFLGTKRALYLSCQFVSYLFLLLPSFYFSSLVAFLFFICPFSPNSQLSSFEAEPTTRLLNLSGPLWICKDSRDPFSGVASLTCQP